MDVWGDSLLESWNAAVKTPLSLSSVFLLFNFTTEIVKVVIKRSKKSRNSNNINSSFGLEEYLYRALWVCCMLSPVVSG